MVNRPTVAVFDTTLRDGEQAPGFSMSPADKVRLAGHLERARRDVIEAGFPMASAADFDGVVAVSRPCGDCRWRRWPGRCPRTCSTAWNAVRSGRPGRASTCSWPRRTSTCRRSCASRARNAWSAPWPPFALARSLCDDVEFSAEDATRSDLDFLCEVADAVADGRRHDHQPARHRRLRPARRHPPDVHRRGRARRRSSAVLSAHCHNDLGLAVANSLAAVQAGARQVECTINGIGERAGNAALEEIVMALDVRGDAFGCRTASSRPSSSRPAGR